MVPTEMPVLRRKPVLLRAFTESDAELVRSVADDPQIPLITTVPTSGTLADALAFIKRQHDRLASGAGYSFAIVDSAGGEPVGQIGLWLRDLEAGRVSVGYWIASAYRGLGYAVAALDAISRWGLSLDGVFRIELQVEPWNEGSWRAAERVGYVREGLMRSWREIGSGRRDLYLYSLLPGDLERPAT
ncbi:MAG TPA: GNAT family protein [Streptosporangiaceae bacterium]|nr:GNAT family protein [Streptosporangiaceae bacterium]